MEGEQIYYSTLIVLLLMDFDLLYNIYKYFFKWRESRRMWSWKYVKQLLAPFRVVFFFLTLDRAMSDSEKNTSKYFYVLS